MANLTSIQADDIWDNKFESRHCTFTDSSKDHYAFSGELDGKNYYVKHMYSDTVITGASSDVAIQTQIKTDLQTQEYQGAEDVPTIVAVA